MGRSYDGRELPRVLGERTVDHVLHEDTRGVSETWLIPNLPALGAQLRWAGAAARAGRAHGGPRAAGRALLRHRRRVQGPHRKGPPPGPGFNLRTYKLLYNCKGICMLLDLLSLSTGIVSKHSTMELCLVFWPSLVFCQESFMSCRKRSFEGLLSSARCWLCL